MTNISLWACDFARLGAIGGGGRGYLDCGNRFAQLLVQVEHFVVFSSSKMSLQTILTRAHHFTEFTVEVRASHCSVSSDLLLSQLLLVVLSLKMSLVCLLYEHTIIRSLEYYKQFETFPPTLNLFSHLKEFFFFTTREF